MKPACILCRGETFRHEFTHLGEVRSLVPEHVRMMALTATATKATRTSVCRTLGMKSPIVVSVTPNKLNIKYSVEIIKVSLEETFAPLVEEVRLNRVTTNRAIIYCHSYESCSHIYLYLTHRLGPEKTEPIGAPDIDCFRLIDMFTACTTPPVKENILASFCKLNGKLRLVVATVAFGMGLDCPNVRNIYHWGAPGDLEQYLQETGRAGRDSLPAVATLFYKPADLAHNVELPMKEYCRNKDICRRQLLLSQFDGTDDSSAPLRDCMCCDICSHKCKCHVCISQS